MSIATLKRKSQVKYNNMSVGQKNFSITGTHRNQGYIGQTSLSRSLPKTLMKGNVERGMGGCCGTYNLTPIVQSAVTSLEDSTVIKPSTMGNVGLLLSKYRWARRPGPNTVVKPDMNRNNTTSGDYIKNLRNCTITQSNLQSVGIEKPLRPPTYNPYFRQRIQLNSKPQSSYLPITSGEYTEMNLTKKCSENDNLIANPSNRSPLPGN